MKTRTRLVAPLLLLVCCPPAIALDLWPWGADAASVRQARLPTGFELELLVAGLDGPRMLTFAANGELLIGSKSGRIYRLLPPYREPQVLLRLDNYPHSLALRPGELLIAQTDGVYRVPYRPGQPAVEPADVRLLAALPGGGGHSSRTLGIGPDGRVYVSLGINGNCSDQYLDPKYPFDDRRGGVLVLDKTRGSPRFATFASGLRNPVGFDWQPGSGALYASNNGPDHLGYELPPEYFSRLEPGSFHGMPWFYFDGQRMRPDDCIRRPPRWVPAMRAMPSSRCAVPGAPARAAAPGVTGPADVRRSWWGCALPTAGPAEWRIWSAAFSKPTASVGRARWGSPVRPRRGPLFHQRRWYRGFVPAAVARHGFRLGGLERRS